MRREPVTDRDPPSRPYVLRMAPACDRAAEPSGGRPSVHGWMREPATVRPRVAVVAANEPPDEPA